MLLSNSHICPWPGSHGGKFLGQALAQDPTHAYLNCIRTRNVHVASVSIRSVYFLVVAAMCREVCANVAQSKLRARCRRRLVSLLARPWVMSRTFSGHSFLRTEGMRFVVKTHLTWLARRWLFSLTTASAGRRRWDPRMSRSCTTNCWTKPRRTP